MIINDTHSVFSVIKRFSLHKTRIFITRALTPLFGNGAGAHGIGKISGVLTKIGKFDIVLMYDISIARLIPIIKLTLFLDI